MHSTKRPPAAVADDEHLRRMVGLDPHRPGPARGRLLAESVPVWALIGYINAIAGSTEPDAITDSVVAKVSVDYDVSEKAVRAALLYYDEHRGAIDALLEANAAVLSQ